MTGTLRQELAVRVVAADHYEVIAGLDYGEPAFRASDQSQAYCLLRIIEWLIDRGPIRLNNRRYDSSGQERALQL